MSHAAAGVVVDAGIRPETLSREGNQLLQVALRLDRQHDLVTVVELVAFFHTTEHCAWRSQQLLPALSKQVPARHSADGDDVDRHPGATDAGSGSAAARRRVLAADDEPNGDDAPPAATTKGC